MLPAHKLLGSLNTPVIFEFGEGPDPGVAAEVVNKDSPAPDQPGVAPATIIGAAVVMMIGGYLVLRKLLD